MGEPAAQVGVLSINPRQYFQSNPKVADLPLLARLVQGETRHGRSSREKGLFAKAWLAADPELRRPLLENHLRENVAQILRRKAEAIQVSKPFQDLGFDSLMTLELRNRLENSLGLVLEVTALWKFPTLEALASHLADRLEPQGHEGQRTDSKESSRSADGESDLAIKNLVDALSEEDAETALLKELANILGDD